MFCFPVIGGFPGHSRSFSKPIYHHLSGGNEQREGDTGIPWLWCLHPVVYPHKDELLTLDRENLWYRRVIWMVLSCCFFRPNWDDDPFFWLIFGMHWTILKGSISNFKKYWKEQWNAVELVENKHSKRDARSEQIQVHTLGWYALESPSCMWFIHHLHLRVRRLISVWIRRLHGFCDYDSCIWTWGWWTIWRNPLGSTKPHKAMLVWSSNPIKINPLGCRIPSIILQWDLPWYAMRSPWFWQYINR